MIETETKRLTGLPKARLRAVFTDLDDTLTENARLSSETYRALCRLKEKGFWVVVVSGRPAGSADCLIRLWPVDAIVFENGAGYVRRRNDTVETILLDMTSDPLARKIRLTEVFQKLRARVPHLKLSSDQPYRLFDFAIDYAEEPPRLSPEELSWVLDELGKEPGVTRKQSSIHINYWLGTYDKLTACKQLLETEGKERGITQDQVVYCGDAPNDEPLFEFFEYSVGVANIKKYWEQLKTPPRFVTQRAFGRGFEELVSLLIA